MFDEWMEVIKRPARASEWPLTCRVTVLADDLSTRTYVVETTVARSEDGRVLRAKENADARHLPVFCPIRHINVDGSFCLGFGPTRLPFPKTVEGAREWWLLIRDFLIDQYRAELLGQWPKGKGWAHGEAAEMQQHFEAFASKHPPSLAVAVLNGDVTLGYGAKGTVKERQAPCPCGSNMATKRCHEPELAVLVKLQAVVAARERAYWLGLKSQECCGTMPGCPLALP